MRSFWARFGVYLAAVVGITVGVVLVPEPAGYLLVGFWVGILLFYLGAWLPLMHRLMTARKRVNQVAEETLRAGEIEVPLRISFRVVDEPGRKGIAVGILANMDILTREEAVHLITEMAERVKDGDWEDLFQPLGRSAGQPGKQTPGQPSDSSLN